jgi:hypothetical protein
VDPSPPASFRMKAHLGEHVGLLDPLDDPPIRYPDVVD